MGPLDGVKVLDLTTMVSGPVAAMMLADQGAEVIKVEPPGGEQMRHVGALHNGEIAKWHREEILARLDTHDVPSAPLLTRMELLDHEQILVNGSIDHTKHEGCDHGVFRGTTKCRDQG